MKARASLILAATLGLTLTTGEARALGLGDILGTILRALGGWRRILEEVVKKELLENQEKAQKRIEAIITEIAFPPPPETRRGGVFRAIPLLMAEVRSFGTDLRDLSGDWRFTARTRPIQGQRLGEQRISRTDLERLWGRTDPSRDTAVEQMLGFAAHLTEVAVGSHAVAGGEWASVLPGIEAESAVGTRNTPGEALRDAAWLLANGGRVAQSNSDLMTARLFVETLEAGSEAREQRLESLGALGVYEALGCLDGSCGSRR